MTEPSRTKVSEEELTYYVVDDRRAIRSPWGKGNSKLGKGIYTYSRLPGKPHKTWMVQLAGAGGTCPGATELCEMVCYSLRFQDNPSLWHWMWANTVARENLPLLPPNAEVVRIHVSGDFDTPEYIEAWDRLCQQNPKVQFFGYTRSWRVPELLPCLELLKSYDNIELFASMDETTPELVPNGWRVAWLVADPHKRLCGHEGVLFCPEEDGTKPNCESCGYCFKAKRGDVIFALREL